MESLAFPDGRPRKGDSTRERLYRGAVEEFRHAGFEQASIGRIASRAGTSRASFYVYFPCKEAVLLELQWRMEVGVVERTRDCAALSEFLTGLVDALIKEEAGLGSRDLMRNMLNVYIHPPSGLDLADQPFPLLSEIGRRFTRAKESELRLGLDPAQATDIFATSLFGALVGWPEPLAERRHSLLQLTSLFVADPPLKSRKARRTARKSD